MKINWNVKQFTMREKMQKTIGLWGVIVLSLLVLGSCAPTALIPVTRPAEINLVGINRIAIGDIDGNMGVSLSDLLTQKLFESGRYEVLDRQHIHAVMREHRLNLSGAVDEQTSVKMGGLLGASALILGKSHGQYHQRTEVGKPYKCKENKICRSYEKIGEGRVNTTLKVVDLTTGKIIAIKNYTEEGSDSDRETDEWPPDIDRGVIMGEILDTTANKFMQMIAPYTEYVRVQFEDSKIPQVQAGIETAQSGQWHSASIQFKN
ncbi:MAG: hypothetical protein E4H16_00875, partial [Candidatus Atribacteria bacterium]